MHLPGKGTGTSVVGRFGHRVDHGMEGVIGPKVLGIGTIIIRPLRPDDK